MTQRIARTIQGFEFGAGGPYRLVVAPGAPLRNCVRAYCDREATRLELVALRAATLLDGLPTDAVDAAIATFTEELIYAEAAARRAMYAHGRWSVVVVGGWYLYLTRGIDEHGHAHEPRLATGSLDGIAACPSCEGVGRKRSIAHGRSESCHLCNGAKRFKRELPPAVREAVERVEAGYREATAELEAAHV